MAGQCLLLDFAVYAPPEELKVNRVEFEKSSHKWAVRLRSKERERRASETAREERGREAMTPLPFFEPFRGSLPRATAGPPSPARAANGA